MFCTVVAFRINAMSLFSGRRVSFGVYCFVAESLLVSPRVHPHRVFFRGVPGKENRRVVRAVHGAFFALAENDLRGRAPVHR